MSALGSRLHHKNIKNKVNLSISVYRSIRIRIIFDNISDVNGSSDKNVSTTKTCSYVMVDYWQEVVTFAIIYAFI